ncbi:hypothetical protein [Zeimonas arvi]|uniref:Uncharacterized protein n=1 Tax=Zeimonas arvi TaxID=2498847 RepID=A0A5C8NRE1_9BURK|nr:hypothetical protein [Zeimonas arvi]TXL63912.1 hypothetical protein FHP08_16605 [Zeimonas arvi]
MLLGIGKEEWELINSFSGWLSALGTTGAVIVSLYLARRAYTPRARVSVGLRLIISPGDVGDPPEFLVFHITNTGDRPVRITGIGWRVGWPSRRHAMQNFGSVFSSPLPIELGHGQEASWFVPLDQRDEPWVNFFARTMLRGGWLERVTLRGTFATSTGVVFLARPEREFLLRIRDARSQARQ